MGTPALTTADTLKCLHGGTVTVVVPPTRTLTAGGNPVLVMSDLPGATIAGCTFTTSSGPSPCLTVIAVSSGTSLVLTVDGSPVLLAGAGGTAANPNLPGATWSALSSGSNVLWA
jgi:hypothetical protein